MTFTGATRIDGRGLVTASDAGHFGASSDAEKKPAGEIESSTNAAIPAAAGEFLLQNAGFLNRESVLGDQDPLPLAERWLRRAHGLDPHNGSWTDVLITALQAESNAALDPREKARFLQKALDAAGSDGQQLRVLPNLANAEFEARDDAAAERDAQRLLELAQANPKARESRGSDSRGANRAGARSARSRQQTAGPGTRLLESARVRKSSPGLSTAGPKLTLAQDLIEAGERDVVLQYLDLCRAFWTNDQGKIDRYVKLVKSASAPDLLARIDPGLSGAPGKTFCSPRPNRCRRPTARRLT